MPIKVPIRVSSHDDGCIFFPSDYEKETHEIASQTPGMWFTECGYLPFCKHCFHYLLPEKKEIEVVFIPPTGAKEVCFECKKPIHYVGHPKHVKELLCEYKKRCRGQNANKN